MLKQQTRFGLVFERHLPEMVLSAANGALRVGDQVRLRDGSNLLRVTALKGTKATVSDGDGSETLVKIGELLLVRQFGDPIYPTLTSLGRINQGGDKPYHAVIEAENYHALQMLQFAVEGEVDCIYIDPPYNTGARDWKYNNDYVDDSDRWRHSKWLAFMERRLRMAKRLLKPDGVLVITIDHNEVHHLGMLLERHFAEAMRQMVTVCINPGGAAGEGFSRVDEYALFCFLGDARPIPVADDMLVVGEDEDSVHVNAEGVRWEWLMRGGASWYRESRRNLCYPVILNEEGTRIVKVGPPLDGSESKRPKRIGGLPVAWPVRRDGKLGIWRVDGARLSWLAERGYAYVSRRDDGRGTWTVKYLMKGTVNAIEAGSTEVVGRDPQTGRVNVRVGERKGRVAKTMWYRGRHTAGGGGGTQLLNTLLGERNLFSYPKSVYSTRDALQVAVGDRQDALIVDFFGGSATTLHATMLLNQVDDGRRRCIVVTNNELDEATARNLKKKGLQPGDQKWEARGVFRAVAKPRIEAAITGKSADGATVKGSYLDGRSYAEGFLKNCEFFHMDCLDPDDVELGRRFDELHPLLWFVSGARGDRPEKLDTTKPFEIVERCGYAVLFDETALRDFVAALNDAKAIDHIFLITPSEDAYAEMCEELGRTYVTHMLYRDYLETFRVSARY